MFCKYCNSQMMSQGTDKVMYDYIELHVCINSKCRAVYEEYRDLKGRSESSKNRWFNPKTKEFEKA